MGTYSFTPIATPDASSFRVFIRIHAELVVAIVFAEMVGHNIVAAAVLDSFAVAEK